MPVSAVKKSVAHSIHREIARVHAGLKFRAVVDLQRELDLPLEKLAPLLGISRATLHRRRQEGKLDAAESERVARYQRLLARATDVFREADAARQWLNAPQRALGGAVPVEFAASELGAREVENLLGRLEYGVYS